MSEELNMKILARVLIFSGLILSSERVFAETPIPKICSDTNDISKTIINTVKNQTITFSLRGKSYSKQFEEVGYDENNKISYAILHQEDKEKITLASGIDLFPQQSKHENQIVVIRFSNVTGNPRKFGNFSLKLNEVVSIPHFLSDQEISSNVNPDFDLEPDQGTLCIYYGYYGTQLPVTSKSAEKLKPVKVTFQYPDRINKNKGSSEMSESIISESLRGMDVVKATVKYEGPTIELGLVLDEHKVIFAKDLRLQNLSLKDFSVSDSARIDRFCAKYGEIGLSRMGLSCFGGVHRFTAFQDFNIDSRSYSTWGVRYLSTTKMKKDSTSGLLTSEGVELD
jgi:hypothetical protein